MARLVGTTSFAPGTQPQLAKVDKDAVDEFDSWSFNRAETLMAANYSALRRSSLRSAFTLGWYFDPFFNCYTFIPGGGLYFSPYGFPSSGDTPTTPTIFRMVTGTVTTPVADRGVARGVVEDRFHHA
jgi:hypothetical protein